MNKKGDATGGTIMGLMLVSAFIVFFMITVGMVATGVGKETSIKQCKLTTSAGSLSVKGPGLASHLTLLESPVKSKCKTFYIDIKGKKYGKDTEEEKEELKILVMDEVATCWEQFGAGKTAVQEETDTDRACFTCSIIFPDKKFKNELSAKLILNDMYTFALMHEYKKGTSYITYLTSEGTLPEQPYPLRSITLNQPYYTVFQVMKRHAADAAEDSAVVDCKIAGIKDKLEGEQANEIGCNSNGEVEGINFGKAVGKENSEGTLTVRLVPATGITKENCRMMLG
ncbi:hypothetical protein HYU12_05465 [Candidatus Woesearchaeota archaeon]|nr:hypothetical protein [Candidatus Woesearchaeota archaeon]